MAQPHLYELVRSLLIFLHLACLIAAGASIAFGDYAILRHRPVNRALMLKASRAVAWSLLALWLTGLSVIALDMSTVALSLAKAPKLLAKLTVVVILSLNGFLLHRYTLHALGETKTPTESDVRLAAILGAVSAASWGYAVFLGVAKAWTPILGYNGFMALYVMAVLAGVAVSLRWVRPLLLEQTPLGTSNARTPTLNEGLTAEDLNAAMG